MATTKKAAASASSMEVFQEALIKQLNLADLGDNQKVVFEAPGRVLSEDDYQYQMKKHRNKGTGNLDSVHKAVDGVTDPLTNPSNRDESYLIYNEFRKPYVIKDAEFELTDIYFHLNDEEEKKAFTTRGAGKQGFAELYEDLVMQSQPIWPNTASENSKNYREGMKRSIDYLQTVVKNKDGKEMTIKQLFLEKKEQYALAKQAWEEAKRERMDFAEQTGDFEEYSEWLAANQEAELDKIEARLQDWILEGQRHEVYKALEIINQGTVFEELEEAKENLEISKRANLHGDGWVYRTNMSPSNWANYLNTDFPVQNLCDNPKRIQENLINVTLEYEHVLDQINELTADNSNNEQQLSELQQQRDAAEDNLRNLRTQMMDQFGSNTIFAVELAIKIQAGGAAELLKTRQEGQETGDPQVDSIDSQALGQILDGLKKVNENQANMDKAQSKLAHLQMDVIGTKTKVVEAGTKLPLLIRKRDQLAKRKRLLEAFRQESFGCYKYNKDEDRWEKDPKANARRLPRAQKGWTDVTINTEYNFQSEFSREQTSQKSNSGSVNGFFFSAGWSSSSGKSTRQNFSKGESVETEVGFRAAKVNITRGGWFKPDIFSDGKEFAKLYGFENRIGAFKNMYYPTALIVAKDVTVKLRRDFQVDSSWSHAAESQNQAGGGCAFFSIQSSNSCSSNASYSRSVGGKEEITLNIGSPQVVGWIVERFFRDGHIPVTKNIPAMQSNFFYHPNMIKKGKTTDTNTKENKNPEQDGSTARTSSGKTELEVEETKTTQTKKISFSDI